MENVPVKRLFSSDEENSDEDLVDSCVFVSKKNKKNEKEEFDSVAYIYKLSIKLGKLQEKIKINSSFKEENEELISSNEELIKQNEDLMSSNRILTKTNKYMIYQNYLLCSFVIIITYIQLSS